MCVCVCVRVCVRVCVCVFVKYHYTYYVQLRSSSNSGVSNPVSGELPTCRLQLQPQTYTPEAGNQGVQGYLMIACRVGDPATTTNIEISFKCEFLLGSCCLNYVAH